MANKRRCTEPIATITSDESDSDFQTAPNFPHFLVIESREKTPITKVSPFLIEKNLHAFIGKVDSVKKLNQNEQLLIETSRKNISDKILKLKEFCNLNVDTYPHKSLNSSKGVIKCSDLSSLSEEEILTELTPQHVSGVRRISFLRDGQRVPTSTYVLTFSTPNLPKMLKVGYLFVKVTVYIPNPLRCFFCQKFGHHETRCRSETEICTHCGQDAHIINAQRHSVSACVRPAKCVNCGESHDSRSKECSVWKKEKEILKIKYKQNISFPEARKIVNENFKPISEKSLYSSIIKSASPTLQVVDAWTQDKKDDQPSGKIIIPSKYKSTEKSKSDSSQAKSTSSTQKPKKGNTSNSKENTGSSVDRKPSDSTSLPKGNRRRTPSPKSPTKAKSQTPNKSRSRGRNRRSTASAAATDTPTSNKFESLMDTGDPSDDQAERSRSPILPP